MNLNIRTTCKAQEQAVIELLEQHGLHPRPLTTKAHARALIRALIRKG